MMIQFLHYSNVTMKYLYCSNISFTMFWTDIARFLQYFRNLFDGFINIVAILQNVKGIFSINQKFDSIRDLKKI